MVSLLLAFALAQPTTLPADAPTDEAPSLVPSEDAASQEPLAIATPDGRGRRVALTLAGGVVGAGAALGISVALTTCFGTCVSKVDTTFANAALSSLMIAGVSYAVHQALGGRGEIFIPTLASIAIMAMAGFVGPMIDPRTPQAALWTSALGAVPASLAVAFLLERTETLQRGRVRAW